MLARGDWVEGGDAGDGAADDQGLDGFGALSGVQGLDVCQVAGDAVSEQGLLLPRVNPSRWTQGIERAACR
jgi:hypothetical protein